MGSGPDLVILSALFWDLARNCGGTNDLSECKKAFLRPTFLEGWMRNYTSLFHRAKRAVGPQSTTWVYHTQVSEDMLNLH